MLDVTGRAGDRVTARLPEDVDLYTTPGLRAVVDRIIDEGCRHLTLDASALQHLDSTGVTALIVWHRRLDAVGGALTLTGLAGHFHAMLTRLGLHNAFAFEPEAPSADNPSP
ncbi:STAS domain-containing protein [Streptomyces sp. NPDC086081]|uniref:STAS domain-containing protein n=1 Tax=Streptomyces sp. NPDC086081 TaxID=3365749 RepID=UPI00380FC999